MNIAYATKLGYQQQLHSLSSELLSHHREILSRKLLDIQYELALICVDCLSCEVGVSLNFLGSHILLSLLISALSSSLKCQRAALFYKDSRSVHL